MSWYTKYPDGPVAYEQIGEMEIAIPRKPDNQFIANTELPKQKQKWRRIVPDKRFESLSIEEQKNHPFVKREFHRKRHGYWFMNNGEPTYITGLHYIFLQHWTMDDGQRPSYRSCDRRFFLFWENAMRDRDCLGVLYFTQRRGGKTTISTFLMFIIITSLKNAHGGIQSKDDKGGKMVFRRHLLNGIKNLPGWLKPIRAGAEDPKGMEIEFFEPSTMLTRKRALAKSQEKKTSALDSKISYGTSTETYYDGEKMMAYLCDEFGKGDRVDAVERHDIITPCLMVGKNIVGKAIYTTTVEDMGQNALANAEYLWHNSDPKERDENNRTSTKMFRYFKPASDGMEGFIDEYGNSMEEEARDYIMNERRKLKEKGDLKRWAAQVRKFPLDPSEPFTPNAQDCLFDVGRLASQKDTLQTLSIIGRNPVVRGNLVWKDSIRAGWEHVDHFGKRDLIRPSEVVFIPSSNGKFLRSYPPKNPNNIGRSVGGLLQPRNAGLYSAGIDPFDFSTTTTGKGSNGSGAIFIHPNIMEPDESDRWAMIYDHRPDHNTEFYEDMVKMLHYYGCKGVVERNKAMCRNYIANRGFQEFIYGKLRLDPTIPVKRSDNIAGEYTGKSQLVSITDAFDTYIYENYQKIDFIELINQLFSWTIKDSNKYDLVIACGFALLAARYSKQAVITPPTQSEAEKIQNFFPVYDYRGNNSVRK